MTTTELITGHLFMTNEALLVAEQALATRRTINGQPVANSDSLQRAIAWRDIARGNLKHTEELIAHTRKGSR